MEHGFQKADEPSESRYDKRNAILSIYAGAGGQDAQDWATMLLRMYEKYADFKGWQARILDQSFGEGGGPQGRIGTKSATLEIRGEKAYGSLKGEIGVHRLVRLSPFSTKKLRHTSFARVEVLPEIGGDLEREVKINPQDLRVDVFRSSGPGGQYVNKRESAVRITHIPTGIKAACQSERLQGQNKERAMKVLKSYLYRLKEQAKQKELDKLKGDRVLAEWGSQTRNYVLHPYKMVKDLKTGVKISDVESVLEGRLDKLAKSKTKK